MKTTFTIKPGMIDIDGIRILHNSEDAICFSIAARQTWADAYSIGSEKIFLRLGVGGETQDPTEVILDIKNPEDYNIFISGGKDTHQVAFLKKNYNKEARIKEFKC
jgi:hypothetical protein